MTQDPSRMDIPDLLALCAKLDAALAGTGAATYGVPEFLATDLAQTATSLQQAAGETEAKRQAYLAQKQTHDGYRSTCAYLVSAVARAIYAMPTNSPTMIVEAGLKPRSDSRTRVVPVTPERLFAKPLPNGDVALDWDRTGNAEGVNFIVESRLPGGDWQYAGDTTATRLTVSGYAPGQSVELRVSASKNKTTTKPSATATVFPAQSSAALRLAA